MLKGLQRVDPGLTRGWEIQSRLRLWVSRMSYLDWGMHDLTEAVEYLDDGSTPIFWWGTPRWLVLGMIPNHHKVTGWPTTSELAPVGLVGCPERGAEGSPDVGLWLPVTNDIALRN